MCLQIAKQFAQALDEEDYKFAHLLLDAECEYSCRGETFLGPGAIIESYRGNGDSAKQKLDSIHYESSASPLEHRVALITFTDHLTHCEQRFTFECQQKVTVNDSGLIVRIEHIDLPGQCEALACFIRQLGIA